MYRSFIDRVFGGICGGLGAVFGISAWWFRFAFVGLSLITMGGFVVLYILLWWIIPQESPTERRRGGSGRLLLTIILAALVLVGWYLSSTGVLISPSGQNLYWPILVLVLGSVFFLRQVRA
jgi:phage shock protein C